MPYELELLSSRDYSQFTRKSDCDVSANHLSMSIALEALTITPCGKYTLPYTILNGNLQGKLNSSIFYELANRSVTGFATYSQRNSQRSVYLHHNLFPSTVGSNSQGHAVVIELNERKLVNKSDSALGLSDTNSDIAQLVGSWNGSIGIVQGNGILPMREKFRQFDEASYRPYKLDTFAQATRGLEGVSWQDLFVRIKKI